MNSDNILNLYEHNEETSSKVFDAFNKDEKRVAIVQATGTGKSYVALNLLLKYKDKKALYIVPSNAIIEHLKEIISKNNLSIEKDFPNLEFRTYQSLINLSKEELSKLNVDLLVTDELHHLGAPVWGKRINDIVETHPDMLLFGMTAYTVRDRATAYERDMINPETDELFSGKVVSYYDLCDAMIDGVLPKPIYKAVYINLESLAEELEKYLDDPKLSKKDYLECKKLIEDAKRQITKAPGIKEMVRKNIKPNGKYIYFCPPLSEENKNDIDTIMNEVREWFSDYDVEFYKTTSKDQEQGKQNRDAFYSDVDLKGNSTKHKLRIMFAINQYNEGVHVPGVDGVILGRSTSSDIVFFEQIGRALSVKENTKEKYENYQNLSRNELLEVAQKQNTQVTSNMTKDEIIERLLSPVIIDLTNNIEYIEAFSRNDFLHDCEKGIFKILEENLPKYMIPEEFYYFVNLPLSTNGKIDRNKILRSIEMQEDYFQNDVALTDSESRLAKIWKDILGAKNISKSISFFEAGGDSLLSTKLMMELRKEYNVEVALTDIFENPYLEQMASMLDKKIDAENAYVEGEI